MKPVSIALIGCGAVTEHYYVPALKKPGLEIATVKALFDPEIGRMEKLQQHFVGCALLPDLANLREIDLAIVASPAGFHAEQAIIALNQDCNVLCEKPMALSSVDCRAMVEAAKTKNKLLAIGHFRRHFQATLAIKKILEQRLLGEIKSFCFHEGSPFQWPSISRALFDKTTAGGGVLMDLGVHLLDLALWLFGEAGSVDYEDDAMGGVEANCRLQLQFASGVQGIVKLSRDWYLDNVYTIECERGKISWQFTPAGKVVVTPGVKEVEEIIARHCLLDTGVTNHEQAFFDQLQSVISTVANGQTGSAKLVAGAEAVKSIELIESCYAQGKLMPMPWLNDVELERAMSLHAGLQNE